MFGWFIVYLVSVVFNVIALGTVDVTYKHPVYWISGLCVIAAYISGREFERRMKNEE